MRRIKNKKSGKKSTLTPLIIPRAEHTISRNDIHPNALKVLYRLHNAGYSSYLVGGCVRDLLLGGHPKDFDIATNAKPEEVRRLFKNCRLIGKRFRLAHILFGREIIEVATFRTHHQNAQEHLAKMHEGMIIRDNVYGNIEDDVLRRDFSINALYYNIADFSVVDYTGGMLDIKNKVLRMIGTPNERFLEDPVRLLRAVRFASKLPIVINEETEKSLLESSQLLENVSPARLFQEVLKIFQGGSAAKTFKLLEKYHLLKPLFSQTQTALKHHETRKLVEEALANTDQRFREKKTISPAFLLAALLWRPVVELRKNFEAEGLPPYVALEKALEQVFKLQTQQLAIPRNILTSVREIYVLQHFFTRRSGNRPFRLLEHVRYRAAYDLLLLRAHSGEPVQELADWWTQFTVADEEERQKLIGNTTKNPIKKRSHRRKRKKPVIKNTINPTD